MDEPLISRNIFRGGGGKENREAENWVKSSPKQKETGTLGWVEPLMCASGMYARPVPSTRTKRSSVKMKREWDDSRKLIRDVSRSATISRRNTARVTTSSWIFNLSVQSCILVILYQYLTIETRVMVVGFSSSGIKLSSSELKIANF